LPTPANGSTPRAIELYEDLLGRMLGADPRPLTKLTHALRLSDFYASLGELHRRADRTAEAAALDGRRRELWQHWEQERPGNLFERRQLGAGGIN
jgi:hypothetical protein